MTSSGLDQRLRNLVPVLDDHAYDLFTGVSWAMFLQAVGVAAAFAFRVAVGRTLGPDGTGLFFLAQTALVIGGSLGMMGLDSAAIRFTAAGVSTGDYSAVAGAYRLAVRYALLTSAALTAALVLGAGPLALHVFHEPRLAAPLRWMALGIAPLALLKLHGEFLKGRRKIAWGLVVSGVIIPTVAIVMTLVLARRFGLPGVVGAYLSGTVVATLVGVAVWRRGSGRLQEAPPRSSHRMLLASAMPILALTLAQLIGQHSGILVLGALAGMDQVGVFAVALRTAMMTSLVLQAVNSVAAPRFAALHALGDRRELERVARTSTFAIVVIAAPALVLFVCAPSWVLGIFGGGFRVGAAALTVLAVGQFFNAATGSVGWLLKMSGHEALLRNVVVSAQIVTVALCLILVPRLGLIGAAWATTVGVILQNAATSVLVWRRLGIVVAPIPLPRRAHAA